MEALFDERQNVGITIGLGVNDTIRMKANLHQARSKQIAPGQAPEHRSFEAGGNPSREERGGPGKLRCWPMLDHLVQGSEGKPSSRQMPVERRDAKGQGLARAMRPAKPLDLAPQVVDDFAPGGHRSSSPPSCDKMEQNRNTDHRREST